MNSNYDADSIVSTKETHINTAFIQDESKYLDIVASNIEKLNKTNRQSLKKQITPSGGFYILGGINSYKINPLYTKHYRISLTRLQLWKLILKKTGLG